MKPKSYLYSYIYKLTLKDQSTYIGLRHCNCLPEEDPYLGSGSHYEKEDVIKKEILISGDFDDHTLALLETVAIMDDKAENPKNKNVSLGAYFYNQLCLSRYNESVRKVMSDKAKARWNRKDQREHLEACRRRQMTPERRARIKENVRKTCNDPLWKKQHAEAIKEGLKKAKNHPRYIYILSTSNGALYASRKEALEHIPYKQSTLEAILAGDTSKDYLNLGLKRISCEVYNKIMEQKCIK